MQLIGENMSQPLYRKYEFNDFNEAYDFVGKIVELANTANHHPDITFGWGFVEVKTISHDVGEVTDRDRILVKQIDAQYNTRA